MGLEMENGVVRMGVLICWDFRIESYGADYELVGVFVYCFGRVVGRGQGYYKG